MLRSVKEMMGYRLAAEDGAIGKVRDLLFDGDWWTIRWLVADTGSWLPERKVLVSPISIGPPDWTSETFPVRLTKSEIESAPGLSEDEPVSREYETKFFEQYSWPYYWAGSGIWGGAVIPGDLFSNKVKADTIEGSPEAVPHALRSMEEVSGYHIQALDEEIGHVHDFIVDEDLWAVRYIVVDTRNWLPGKKILLSPSWISKITWAEQKVFVGMTRAAVQDSPHYDSTAPVNREYEASLYDYYGRPAYWQD